MHGHRSSSGTRNSLCNLTGVDRSSVKALSNLDGYRFIRVLYHSIYHVIYQFRILHQCRPISVLNYLGNGTAHIDINDNIWMRIEHTCSLRHHLRLTAKYLNGSRPCVFRNIQKSWSLPISVEETLCTHHLCASHSSALLSAQHAHDCIGDARKRCQQERVMQLYTAYNVSAI